MDLFGVAVLLGVSWRSTGGTSSSPTASATRENPDNTADDAVVLLLLPAIIVTGFIIEALRIHVTHPSWEVWSFVGWLLAKAFAGRRSRYSAKLFHKVTWWMHTLLSRSASSPTSPTHG